MFEELTVLQNLDIAAGADRSPWQLLRRRKDVLPQIEEALETTGLTAHRDTPAGILAHGQKQWLEIGMLLVQNADVLLLDEPVAGMSTTSGRRPAGCCVGSAPNARSSSSNTTWISCGRSRPR